MDMMDQEQGMPPAPEQGQGGYCIEIYVGPDNKVQRVEVEQKGAPEPMGDDQGMGGEPAGNVQDIKQALDMAMQIYQSGGKMGGNAPQEDAMGQAMEGYGSGGLRGRPGMNVRKVLREG